VGEEAAHLADEMSSNGGWSARKGDAIITRLEANNVPVYTDLNNVLLLISSPKIEKIAVHDLDDYGNLFFYMKSSDPLDVKAAIDKVRRDGFQFTFACRPELGEVPLPTPSN
jgi:hypothetical protein